MVKQYKTLETNVYFQPPQPTQEATTTQDGGLRESYLTAPLLRAADPQLDASTQPDYEAKIDYFDKCEDLATE